MDSPAKIQPNGNDSSSSSNSAPLPPLPAISARLGRLLDVVARRLGELDKLIEEQPNLQTITLVIKLDRRGKPRTVLVRTEAKTELSS